jgi:hypothetical protein
LRRSTRRPSGRKTAIPLSRGRTSVSSPTPTRISGSPISPTQEGGAASWSRGNSPRRRSSFSTTSLAFVERGWRTTPRVGP